MDASITFLNDGSDNSILDSEVNSGGILAIPIIKITFGHYYIHVLHYLLKKHIYGYFISNLISPEATIQNTIQKNIYLFLVEGKGR